MPWFGELVYVAQDRVIAPAVKCLTRHTKRGEEQEMCVDIVHDKSQMQRCRCKWTLIGPEICLEGRARLT